jgi:hypothetical protein
MPIYQKGTDSFTTVKDIYLCTGANAFSRICKVYICTGANTFQLVYDGCGFACDGYFLEDKQCPSTRIVNYYGEANTSSNYSSGYTYTNGGGANYWDMTTYQCSSCPPPGNIIIEYQTCASSSGTISPYLFVNRGINKIENFLSCYQGNDIENTLVCSMNSFIPLINANMPTSPEFGKDPGICTCVDEDDWKIPSSINYITSRSATTSAIQISTVNNGSWTTLTCDDQNGFRENLNLGNVNFDKTYSKYGIFWGADETETSNSCPNYCYGTSGGGPESGNNSNGYTCKSVAKLPLLLGITNGSTSDIQDYLSTDIKNSSGTTADGIFKSFRLYNLGFGVKITGSPKWKLKITYPVYFSELELDKMYDLTEANNFDKGTSYEWTSLFNTIPGGSNGRTFFDLLMMKPLTCLYLEGYNSGGIEQYDLFTSAWHRTSIVSDTTTVPDYGYSDASPYLINGNITNKPIYCLSIEISGDGNGICSSAIYSGSDSNRKIKLEPMTNSSGNLFEQYEMFSMTYSTTININATFQEVYDSSNCLFIGGSFAPCDNNNPHFMCDDTNSMSASIPDTIDNWWTSTKQITLKSATDVEGIDTDCSGEDD